MASMHPQVMIEDYKGGIVAYAKLDDRHVHDLSDRLCKLTAGWPGVQVDVQLDKDGDFMSVEVTGLLTGDQHAAIHREVGCEANRIEASQSEGSNSK